LGTVGFYIFWALIVAVGVLSAAWVVYAARYVDATRARNVEQERQACEVVPGRVYQDGTCWGPGVVIRVHPLEPRVVPDPSTIRTPTEWLRDQL